MAFVVRYIFRCWKFASKVCSSLLLFCCNGLQCVADVLFLLFAPHVKWVGAKTLQGQQASCCFPLLALFNLGSEDNRDVRSAIHYEHV